MQQPEWTKYQRVDVMIECYDITKETQRELLEKMPDAYGGEGPGEDDYPPEPDAPREAPYKLDRIWNELSAAAQADLIAAYEKEN